MGLFVAKNTNNFKGFFGDFYPGNFLTVEKSDDTKPLKEVHIDPQNRHQPKDDIEGLRHRGELRSKGIDDFLFDAGGRITGQEIYGGNDSPVLFHPFSAYNIFNFIIAPFH